jgi:hypothetical protein
MKIAARILSLAIIASAASLFMGCGGDDKKGKSEQDTQLELLNGTWNANSVTLDGSAPSANHDNFVLTINASAGNTTMTYSDTGRPSVSPWPGTGTFTFGTNVKSDLVRDDAVDISYTVDGNSLVMTFTFNKDPYAGGRISSVTGQWRFEFTKVQ